MLVVDGLTETAGEGAGDDTTSPATDEFRLAFNDVLTLFDLGAASSSGQHAQAENSRFRVLESRSRTTVRQWLADRARAEAVLNASDEGLDSPVARSRERAIAALQLANEAGATFWLPCGVSGDDPSLNGPSVTIPGPLVPQLWLWSAGVSLRLLALKVAASSQIDLDSLVAQNGGDSDDDQEDDEGEPDAPPVATVASDPQGGPHYKVPAAQHDEQRTRRGRQMARVSSFMGTRWTIASIAATLLLAE